MTSFLNSITKRKKTPEQLVLSACNSLGSILINPPGDFSKIPEENVCKRLGQMKTILYGDGKVEVDEEKAIELARSIISVK